MSTIRVNFNISFDKYTFKVFLLSQPFLLCCHLFFRRDHVAESRLALAPGLYCDASLGVAVLGIVVVSGLAPLALIAPLCYWRKELSRSSTLKVQFGSIVGQSISLLCVLRCAGNSDEDLPLITNTHLFTRLLFLMLLPLFLVVRKRAFFVLCLSGLRC